MLKMNVMNTYQSKADTSEDEKASPQVCEYDESDNKHGQEGETHVTKQFF